MKFDHADFGTYANENHSSFCVYILMTLEKQGKKYSTCIYKLANRRRRGSNTTDRGCLHGS